MASVAPGKLGAEEVDHTGSQPQQVQLQGALLVPSKACLSSTVLPSCGPQVEAESEALRGCKVFIANFQGYKWVGRVGRWGVGWWWRWGWGWGGEARQLAPMRAACRGSALLSLFLRSQAALLQVVVQQPRAGLPDRGAASHRTSQVLSAAHAVPLCSKAELQAMVKRLGGMPTAMYINSVTHILAGKPKLLVTRARAGWGTATLVLLTVSLVWVGTPTLNGMPLSRHPAVPLNGALQPMTRAMRPSTASTTATSSPSSGCWTARARGGASRCRRATTSTAAAPASWWGGARGTAAEGCLRRSIVVQSWGVCW